MEDSGLRLDNDSKRSIFGKRASKVYTLLILECGKDLDVAFTIMAVKVKVSMSALCYMCNVSIDPTNKAICISGLLV